MWFDGVAVLTGPDEKSYVFVLLISGGESNMNSKIEKCIRLHCLDLYIMCTCPEYGCI